MDIFSSLPSPAGTANIPKSDMNTFSEHFYRVDKSKKINDNVKLKGIKFRLAAPVRLLLYPPTACACSCP
jgi:hypothetical protein